ncbi:MAG: hypothetical protein ACKVP0_10190 [Pirellulaceae bacterium]
MRTIVVFLSIASLLACPYECAVKQAAAQACGTGHQPDCCDQCQARETTEPSDSQAPPPAPNEDGRWCLCDGVVFDVAARPVVDHSFDVSLWTWVCGPAEVLDFAVPMPSVDSASLPPPLDGRLTRIAIHSLLL